MQYAQRFYLPELYLPREYRTGKYTRFGSPKTGRETLLQLNGPGVLKRIWTTHKVGTEMAIHIYVDGLEQPVVSGPAHELAQAAEHIVRPDIPLGGFYDHRSANLYLPIPFCKSLRIDAEALGETGDGPYWQIDYALGGEDKTPLPRQASDANGKPTLFYEDAPVTAEPLVEKIEVLDEDIELRSASPTNLWIEGGGIIREIAISGKALDSLLLRIAFDGKRDGEDRLDGPFQVDAPLRYLVGPFKNACVERTGSKAVIRFPMPFRVRTGIQLLTGMDYGSFSEAYHFNVRVRYEKSVPSPDTFTYFHAQFRSSVTNGRDDFECCNTRGRGHFVGVHIFDTGHDHGGGDNVMFDAGADTAGQLHGICGEDYFHMAYMRIWNRTPYCGCPAHSARYRHHLEMPIPFHESFVFNWGSFAGQPAKAVAFWYQRPDTDTQCNGNIVGHGALYTLTGPFDLESIDVLSPENPFPSEARPWPGHIDSMPTRSWQKRAQQGFVDLCHVHRRYTWAVPPSSGGVPGNICTCAETRLWSTNPEEVTFRLGCDDPVRLYVNGALKFTDEGRDGPDPFRIFKVPASLQAGLNTLRIVVGNTENCNWFWNGFSLTMQCEAEDSAILWR